MYLVIVGYLWDNSRIVGGSNVSIEKYPYQAALYRTHPDMPDTIEFNCGSVIVSPKYLLTAAHCILFGSERYRIVVGQTIISQLTEKSTLGDFMYEVEDVVVHPDFNEREIASSYDNDIAIISVCGNLKLGNSVSPIGMQLEPTEQGM